MVCAARGRNARSTRGTRINKAFSLVLLVPFVFLPHASRSVIIAKDDSTPPCFEGVRGEAQGNGTGEHRSWNREGAGCLDRRAFGFWKIHTFKPHWRAGPPEFR